MKAFISLGLLVLVSLTTVMAVDQPVGQSQQLSIERPQACVAATRGVERLTVDANHSCANAHEKKRKHGFRARM